MALETTHMRRERLTVTGMSCGGCEETVESALATVDGVTRADADNGADTVDVVVEDEVAEEELTEAIEGAGFDVAA